VEDCIAKTGKDVEMNHSLTEIREVVSRLA